MPSALKNFISSYISLPHADWLQIKKSFKQANFKKDEILLEEGKVCRHFYFLEAGLLRFYYNIDGEDITKTFVLSPYCFTSKISFRNQTSSGEGIQVLQDSTVWKINYEQYRELEAINSWNIFMRKLLNEIQEFTEKLMLESKTQTAELRYKLLYDNYPADLLQQIPLKHLASFLGIAPQSLSRIRNNVHKRRS